MSWWMGGIQSFLRNAKAKVRKHDGFTMLFAPQTIHAVSLGDTRKHHEHNHPTLHVTDTAEGSKRVLVPSRYKHAST